MPEETIKLFMVPAGSKVRNRGSGEFDVIHPDGLVEVIRVSVAWADPDGLDGLLTMADVCEEVG